MEMIYLGYLFTVINYIFYCISRFMRKKETILAMDLLAKLFTVVGLYGLGSITGVGNMLLIFVMNIVCYMKEKKKWKLTAIYWVFEMMLVFILWETYAGISSILVFSCSSITLLANWWLNPQHMRISAICGCVLYLAYQISIKNWAGLLELLALGSNFASWLKYRKQDRL